MTSEGANLVRFLKTFSNLRSLPSAITLASSHLLPSFTVLNLYLRTFELVGERKGDNFGDSISMSVDGSILAVGASSGESDNTGQLNIGWVKV